jgi:hypothetical protein
VGREKLHGVLYHAPPPDTASPLLPPRVNTTGLALQDGKVILKRAPKKKVVIRKEVLKRDRNAPRPARTGYNFFFSEARTRDRELNPGRDDQERSAAIGEQWRKMTAEDRQVGLVFFYLCFVFSELFEPKNDSDEGCGDRRSMEAVEQPSASVKPASQPVSNGGRRKMAAEGCKLAIVASSLSPSSLTRFRFSLQSVSIFRVSRLDVFVWAKEVWERSGEGDDGRRLPGRNGVFVSFAPLLFGPRNVQEKSVAKEQCSPRKMTARDRQVGMVAFSFPSISSLPLHFSTSFCLVFFPNHFGSGNINGHQKQCWILRYCSIVRVSFFSFPSFALVFFRSVGAKGGGTGYRQLFSWTSNVAT